jgi:membrane associated rhomboid family serine protease
VDLVGSHFGLHPSLGKELQMPTFRGGSKYFFGGPTTRIVKVLIAVNVAVYVLQTVSFLLDSKFFDLNFGLVPYRVTHSLMLWQFVTYMFLHGMPLYVGIPHIFFNMLALYMFGNELERYWGTSRFLSYYFITGIGAGLCSWFVATNSTDVIVGASGAIYGLLLAYGLTYPNRIVYLNFLLPLKVKWLVILMGAMAFLSSLGGADSGVSAIAHLGGMVIGYLLLKGKDWWDKYRFYYEQKQHEQLKRQFEVYYGDVRRKIEQDKKKGPTIH